MGRAVSQTARNRCLGLLWPVSSQISELEFRLRGREDWNIWMRWCRSRLPKVSLWGLNLGLTRLRHTKDQEYRHHRPHWCRKNDDYWALPLLLRNSWWARRSPSREYDNGLHEGRKRSRDYYQVGVYHLQVGLMPSESNWYSRAYWF